VAIFAVTISFAAALLLALALAAGDIGHVGRVDSVALGILVGSGIFCVGIGQGLYFVSIRLVGVAVSQVMGLAAPFLTGLLAFFFFGDRMSLAQWLSGTLLAAGVAYLLTSRAGPGRAT
jgi:drug/metabolite transporter (DMT)-like permease